MNDDAFHQQVKIHLPCQKAIESGQMNRIMKELGAKLYYDTYAFPRFENGPNWQSETYAGVHLFYDGSEVSAQDSIDTILLVYPLATIGSEYMVPFVKLTKKLASAFDCKLVLNDSLVSSKDILLHCEKLASDLMQNWGEEPGSKYLRILIEEQYA